MFLENEGESKSMPDKPKANEDAASERVKHFEGHGDKWKAVFPEAEHISEKIPFIIPGAKTSDAWVHTASDSDAFAIFMLFPELAPPGIGFIIAHEAGGTTNNFITCYPVLAGAPVELSITGTHPWENGLEGEVTAVTEDGAEISFFDYFFFKNKDRYSPGTVFQVVLAALAFSIEPAADHSVTIDEGDIYEAQKQHFLEKNPGVSPDEFPKELVISFRGARLLLPSSYACEYEFRTPVLSVESVHLAGVKLYKFQVILCGYEAGLPCSLYASEHILKGFVPQVGDDVQGVCWLSGCLAAEFGEK